MAATFDLTANITAKLANPRTVAAEIKKLSGTVPLSLKITNLATIKNQIKSAIKTVSVDVKFDASAAKNVQQLTTKIARLNTELRTARSEANKAAAAIMKFGDSFVRVSNSGQQLKNTSTGMKKVATDTKSAAFEIAEFGRVSGLALRRNSGFLLATGVVFGFVRAVSTAFTEAIKFEREMVKIAQVTNRTTNSLGFLNKQITKLATDLGTPAGQLADIAQTLAQAGFSANQTGHALEALAKTTLAATFGDISETTEGAIALMAQFGIQAKDLEKALGSVNAVSAQFAVESDDIIAAIKRTGGVFAATSKGVVEGQEALNQFIAVFTSIRATTRESAETIATGLRTIFTRIQRPTTINFLRQLGIELTDVEGKFVGPFEAVNKLSKGLSQLDPRNPLFAKVIEELGGFRQVGKVIPLLGQMQVRLQALKVAQEGQDSLAKDAAQAQEALAVQLAKTREAFVALIRDLSQTDTFRFIVKGILDITNSLISLADAVKPVLPLLAALAAFKGLSFANLFSTGFFKGAKGQSIETEPRGLLSKIGGGVGRLLGRKKFASGGWVKGGKGGIDDIPARLTAGEYVINKKAVKAIGISTLERINRLGQPGIGLSTAPMMYGYEDGGLVDNDTKKELEQLRKLDAKLGKNQGARKERARLFESIRRKTLRNETADPKLANLFNGTIEPRFEANIGGVTASGNSAQSLMGDLSTQKQIARAEAQAAAKLAASTRTLDGGSGSRRRGGVGSSDSSLRHTFKENHSIDRSTLIQQILAEGNGPKVQQDLFADPKPIQQQALFDKSVQDFSDLESDRLTTSQRSSVSSATANLIDVEKRRNSFRGRVGSGLRSLFNKATGVSGAPEAVDQFAAFRGAGGSPSGPSSAGGVVGKAKGFLGKAGGRLGGIAGVGAFLGAQVLAEKVGGKTGGVISGGTSGAIVGGQLGAAFGPVGSVIGALAGAALGAVRGFNQADLEGKIKTVSDAMIKNIDKVEDGIAKFNKSGNIKDFNKAFEGGAKASAEKAALDIKSNGPGFFARHFSSSNSLQDANNEAAANAGRNLASDRSTAGEGVLQALEKLTSGGASFDTAVSKLGPDAIVDLALKTGSSGALQSLGEASIDGPEALQKRAASQVLSNNVLRETINAQTKAAQAAKIFEERTKAASKGADLLLERLGNFSAALDRIGELGSGFKRSNDALLSSRGGGAGIRSQQVENVFANPKAFTLKEITANAGAIDSLTGRSKSGNELARSLIGAKQIEVNLPSILGDLSDKLKTFDKDTPGSDTLIRDTIKSNFGGLPGVLQEKLTTDIQKQFFSRQSAPNALDTALEGGEVGQFSENFARQVNDVGKKFVDVFNKNIADYEEALNTFVGLVNEANKSQDDVTQININRQNTLKETFGRRLTVGDRSAGTDAQLTAFGTRAGLRGNFDVRDIANQEQLLSDQSKGPFTGSRDEVARQMAALSVKQQNAVEALKLIASNTDRSVALQSELNTLIDSRKAAQNELDTFATDDRATQRQKLKALDVARREANGGAITERERTTLLGQGRGLLRTFTAANSTDEAEQFDINARNRLGNNADANRFAAAGGLRGNLGQVLANTDAAPQDLRRRIAGQFRQQAEAQQGLANRDRRDATQFQNNAQAQFETRQAALFNPDGLLDRLNETLGKVPQEIAIGGTVNVNLNIPNIDAIGNINPDLQALISAQIREQIKQQFPQDGPSAKPGGTR